MKCWLANKMTILSVSIDQGILLQNSLVFTDVKSTCTLQMSQHLN